MYKRLLERLGRGEHEELQRPMAEVENLAQGQNQPVLLDPAALAVVRAPTARVEDLNAPGPANPVTRVSDLWGKWGSGGSFI